MKAITGLRVVEHDQSAELRQAFAGDGLAAADQIWNELRYHGWIVAGLELEGCQ